MVFLPVTFDLMRPVRVDHSGVASIPNGQVTGASMRALARHIDLNEKQK